MKNNSLGAYIRKHRRSKGLSLKELSTAVGIDVSLLSKIERNERAFSMDLVPALAKALNIHFKDLQTDILAISVIQKYGMEEYAFEGFKKVLKTIEN